MRFIAPFAVSAAPAEAGHDMGAGAAYTVKTYTEGPGLFVPLLHSEFVLKQCELQQMQTAQANISLEDVLNITIPRPTLSLQREFVAIADKVESAKANLKKSIAAIDQVMKGLING